MLLPCCKQFYASMLLESILCESGQICVTGNALMLLETILCKFEQIYMTGNALTLLETILCEIGQICAIASAPMLLETILCTFGRICAIGNAFVVLHCWQELHFEISRQKLNRNVQSPSMWWWLITQPKPIWKKAPPGPQRPSHTEPSIPGVLYWPNPSVPHLGPVPRCPQGLEPPYDPVIN